MTTLHTPNQMDIYRTNSKQMLVTRDPLFVHPTIKQGHYIGRQPHSYFPLAVFVTIINPVLGPIALVFASEFSFFLLGTLWVLEQSQVAVKFLLFHVDSLYYHYSSKFFDNVY